MTQMRTNFDVMRENLTVEQLAEYMTGAPQVNTCIYCKKLGYLHTDKPFEPCDYNCLQHTIEWFKKEVDAT